MKIWSLARSFPATFALVAMLGGVSSGNGPTQRHAQKCPHQNCECEKGGKHHCYAYEPAPKTGLWHHCKPHAPPFLPIVQSLAVRSFSPLTDASQMQLRVERQEAPQQSDQTNGDQTGGDPTQKTGPHQKAGGPVQNPAFRAASAGESYIDDRLHRLEWQVDLLLRKMDEVLQRETRQAQLTDQQVER